MNEYNPGDTVVLTTEIKTPQDAIPAGTAGIVVFDDRGSARVQFVGRLITSNVPTDWLCPVRLAVVAAVTHEWGQL